MIEFLVGAVIVAALVGAGILFLTSPMVAKAAAVILVASFLGAAALNIGKAVTDAWRRR